MANHKIQFDIGFNVQKQQLENLSNQLRKLANTDIEKIKKIKINVDTTELEKAKQAAASAGDALQKAFNTKLGMTNMATFSKELSGSVGTLSQLKNSMSQFGAAGKQAYLDIGSQLSYVNLQFKETTSIGQQLGQTLWNTAKWSIASSALNGITGAIQKAWGFAKSLDSSLNDIRIVTGKSADEMKKFAKEANKAAAALGASTTDYTKASLIYYQQGLDEKDVKARTEATVKAANVTGQSTAEVSEQLTAVWNGYKVASDEAELYVDKLAAVAASTASDLQELSEGMSKVASAANTMGVDIDQLTAQLSTIVSVTRQDASSVGTALKTIYARMGDLAVAGEDEFGTALGDVSGKLKQMGIDVLDQEGNLRDMGEVIEEVAGKWGGWTDAQQQAAAAALAGKRQYNNLIALFENWDMYEKALTTSQDAEGTLQEQQETYMDSIKAHLEELGTAGEKVYNALFSDTEGINKLIDGLTTFVDLIGTIIDGMGGLTSLLPIVLGFITKLMGQKMSDDMNKLFDNKEKKKGNSAIMQLAKENLSARKLSSSGYSRKGVAEADEKIKKGKSSFEENIEKKTQKDQEISDLQKRKEDISSEDILKKKQTSWDAKIKDSKLTEDEKNSLSFNNDDEYEDSVIKDMEDRRAAGVVLTEQEEETYQRFKGRKRTRAARKQNALNKLSEDDRKAYEEAGNTTLAEEEKQKQITDIDQQIEEKRKEKTDIAMKEAKAVVMQDTGEREKQAAMFGEAENDIEKSAKFQDLKLQYADVINEEEAKALDLLTAQTLEQQKLLALKEEALKNAQDEAKTINDNIKAAKEAQESKKKDLEDSFTGEDALSFDSDGKVAQDSLNNLDQKVNEANAESEVFQDMFKRKNSIDYQGEYGGAIVKEDEETKEKTLKWGDGEDSSKNELLTGLESAKEGFDENDEKGKKRIEDLEQYIEAIDKGTISIEDYERAIKIASEGLENKAKNLAEARDAVKEYNDSVDETSEAIEDQEAALKKNEKQQENLGKEMEDISGKINEADAAYQDYEKSLNRKQKIQGITTVISGFTQLLGSMNAIKNLPNVWANQDMSFGEKLLTTATTLGTTMSSIKTMFGGVSQLFAALNPVLIQNRTILSSMNDEEQVAYIQKQLNNKELTEEQQKRLKLNGIKIAGKTATAAELAGMTAEQRARYLSIASQNQERTSIFKTIGLKIKEGATSIIAGTQSFIGSVLAMGVWGIVLLIIIALIAALIIVIAIFANQESAAEKAKKKYEQANAALESYKKNLEDAKNANEELKKSIEDYSKAQKALEELQKGTEEWNEQLEANNQNVMDLMEKYPELVDYISTDANGVMKIADEGLELIEQQGETAVAQANAAVISQKMRTAEAKANWKREVAFEDVQRTKTELYWQKVGEASLQGTAAGGGAGALMGPGAAVAGAGAGATIGFISGLIGAGIEDAAIGNLTGETLDRIAELYAADRNLFDDEESFREALREGNIANNELIDVLWQNKNSIEQATKAQVDATEQSKILEKQYAAAALADDELYKNSDNKDAFATLAAARKTENEQFVNTSIYGKGDDKNKDAGKDRLKEDYAEAMGIDSENITVDGDKVKIKGADGEEKEIAREEAINTIKDYQAMNMVDTTRISRAIDAATQVNQSLSAVVGGAKSVALDESINDFEGLSGQETLRQISEELGMSMDDAAKEYGYESAQAYINAVDQSIEDLQESYKKIGNSLFGSAEAAWNNFMNTSLFKSMDNSQLNGVKDAMETMFKTGGKDGLDQLTAMLNSYSDDPETAAAMAKIAAGIDWTSMTAQEDFRLAVLEAGYTFGEAEKAFVEGMQEFEKVGKSVLKDFDKILEKLNNIKEISEDIKPGDIIKPDEFTKIKAINAEINDLFIRTSDGYKYIGSSSQELNGMLNKSVDGLENIKKEFEDISKASEDYIAKIGGEQNIDASLSVSGTTSALTKRVETLIGNLGTDYSKFISVDQGSLNEALTLLKDPNADTSSTEYKEAKEMIKEVLTETKQTILDYQAGLMDSAQAEEVWATSVAGSLEVVKDSYEKQGISEETYQKARTMWINKYTEELGISTAKWNEHYDDLGDQQQEEKDLQILRDNYFKQELNGYREVDNAIADHERQLEDLEEQQESLTGQEAIDNYQEQIKLNQQLASDKIEYAKVLTEEYESNRKSFDILAKTYGITAEYDKQGRLTQGTINQLETKYLELVEAGNEEEAEAVKSLIEKGEAIDENVESIADVKAEVQELEQSIKDLQVERFDLQLELKLEAGEAKRTFLDFKKNYVDKIAETNLFGTVESNIKAFSSYYDYSYSNTTGTLAYLLNQYNSAATAFNGDVNLIREKQSEVLEQLVDEYESAYDYITEMQEAYTESLAMTQEAFEKQAEAYENINSLLENNLSLVEQVYGESAYNRMSKFYKSMIANNEKSLNLQKDQLDYWTQMKVDMDARVAAASGQEKTDLLASEEYAQIMESYVAATESYYGVLETTLSTLHDDYVNSVNELFDNIAQQFTGGQSLSYISEEWDLLTKKSSKYLDNTNESYQLSKLEYSMNQSIDGFDDNIKAQERLNKLKEQELATLREKDKLTQQDIERANLSYELELKRIALEEAQNSATQMKLTRDAQGNLSYSYVEDTNNIDKLKQEVANMENQLYNFDKDRATSMYEEMLSLYQEYQNKMAEAANNPELQKLYNEQYFGDNGILTSLQTQIQELDGTFEMNKDSGLFKLVEGLKAVDLGETIQKPLNDISTEYQDKVESITSSMEKDFSNIAGHMETIISDSAAFTDAMKEQTDAIATALDRMATEFEKFSKFSLQISDLLQKDAAQKAEDAETEITPIDESLNIQVKQLNAILKHFGEDEITSLDTGGYTGSWGSEGKLAVLHEKELVLNASDTENILAATQIARSLGQVFDEISKILTGDAMSYVNNHSNVMSNTNISNGQGIDQNVQIDAHFPNVTDKQEIQGAFDELINLAIQKAFEDEE